jgi:hypothetical protein
MWIQEDDSTSGPLAIFVVAQGELGKLCTNAIQRSVLERPGKDVLYRRPLVTWEQLETKRQSYVNATLIQSRGKLQAEPCKACKSKMKAQEEKDKHSWARPFPYCVRLPGFFGGACGNCKWQDKGSTCSHCALEEVAGPAAADDEDDLPSEPDDEDDEDYVG